MSLFHDVNGDASYSVASISDRSAGLFDVGGLPRQAAVCRFTEHGLRLLNERRRGPRIECDGNLTEPRSSSTFFLRHLREVQRSGSIFMNNETPAGILFSLFVWMPDHEQLAW